jgi:hypothetical protein
MGKVCPGTQKLHDEAITDTLQGRKSLVGVGELDVVPPGKFPD